MNPLSLWRGIPAETAPTLFDADSVVGGAVVGGAAERLRALVARHAAEACSPLARRLVENWPAALGRFTHVLPREPGPNAFNARRA